MKESQKIEKAEKIKNLKVLSLILLIGIASKTANADDIVAYWRFEEPCDTPMAFNFSSNYNHGKLVKNPKREKVKIGSALRLEDGSYVDCGNDQSLNLSGDFTISLWFCAKDWGGQRRTFPGIISKRSDYETMEWALFYNNHAEHPGIQFWYGKKGKIKLFGEFAITPSLDAWHHLVVTRSQSTWTIYLDGVSKGTQHNIGTIPSNNGHLYIGILGEDGKEQYFNGLVDECSILNRSLSSGEVTKLYTQGTLIGTILEDILSDIENVKIIMQNQKYGEAKVLIGEEMSKYEQRMEKIPEDLKKSAGEYVAAELFFLLGKTNESLGTSKNEIAEAYESGLNLASSGSPFLASALSWLYENVSKEKYQNIAYSIIENGRLDLFDIVTRRAEMIVNNQKTESTIKFIEDNLMLYDNWRKSHPFNDTIDEQSLPKAYFQLAKAKELLDAPHNEVVNIYNKVFNVSHFNYIRESSAALVWLIENDCNNYYTGITKSFAQEYNANNHFTDIVRAVCVHFEASKNWSQFERFLNALFSQTRQSYYWSKFIESCLGNRKSHWANQFFDYVSRNPYVKIDSDRFATKEYEAKNDFKKASALYRNIINLCQAGGDKSSFEFQLCKCLFKGGEYSEAISAIDNFVTKDKNGKNRDWIKEALMLKGQAHIQLGEFDKAVDSFFTLTTEYPESKDSPNANFFIGYCYMLQGKFEQAKEVFNLIVKDYPQSSFASKANLCIARIESMTK